VQAGQLWQVEGANGAGKTSLLRVLAGLARYGFEGSVTRAGVPLYLGHQAGIKGLLSPAENLRLHTCGMLDDSAEAIADALARVGLRGYENTACHQLSAGQHRRVNLARLYLDAAPLWLLDEPFTAIDKAGVAALEQRIGEHVDDGGAVVIVSHQPVTVGVPLQRLSIGGAVAA
jgi:heme exporter protein A